MIDLFETFPNERTESRLVSALLQRPDFAARAVAAGADASWFLMPELAETARVCFDQFRDHGQFNADTVYSSLDERGRIGPHLVTPPRFVDLSTDFVDETTFSDALRRCRAGAHLRKLWRAVDTLRDTVFATEPLGLTERITRLETGLGSLVSLAAGQSDTAYSASDLARLGQTSTTFTPTGLWSFDQEFRGYMPGRITVLAARPSQGKTALALDLSLRMARRLKKGGSGQVVYFSAEMGAKAVSHRLLANIGSHNSRDVASGHIDTTKAEAELGSLPLVIDEAAAPTTAYFLGRCLALHALLPVRMIVFDYLQYTGERAENRRHGLDVALRGLHEVAKRLDCPVLVLAQLNREIDKRGGAAEPQLSDAKETGGLEEIPALVLMLHHEWTHAYQKGADKTTLLGIDEKRFRIYVRKNTHGPLGSVTLEFERTTGRFVDKKEPLM